MSEPTSDFWVRFRGVRGSIPAPGEKTVRYGGNTTCIEIRAGNQLIVLDAGTGIFPLSQSLLDQLPVRCHLFFTHTHWDHIQGLPFFTPLFVPGCHVSIYGAMEPVTQRTIQEVLSIQLQYAYFPVRESELNAHIDYATLQEYQTVTLGDVQVTPILMNHPVVNLGYKIEYQGKAVFFTGDHEWHYNIYDPEDEDFAEYQQLIEEKQRAIIDFIQGVDLLITDSSYTEAEYPAKKGWGHGTYLANIRAARAAGVKRLALTHHEPSRSDTALEQVFAQALEDAGSLPNDPEFLLAAEDLIIEI